MFSLTIIFVKCKITSGGEKFSFSSSFIWISRSIAGGGEEWVVRSPRMAFLNY
jgi:hypothetical protein